MPSALLDLLRHTDGLCDAYGNAVVRSARRTIEENRAMRSTPDLRGLYWSFDQILFSGESGDGDLFGHRVLPDYEGPDDVYRWDHETDSRVVFASSLAEYVARRP